MCYIYDSLNTHTSHTTRVHSNIIFRHDGANLFPLPFKQENDWTALFFAVEGHHDKVLDYLLRSERVDVTHKDKVS